jgi:hypothetical protein
VIAAIAAWAIAIAAGSIALWQYKSTPGAQGVAPEKWPSNASIARASGRATIVVFAHPECPCTRATIDELRVLVSDLRESARARVVFVVPPELGDAWATASDNYKNAASIAGVDVSLDHDGVEAARFGAATSGQTVVYDEFGSLVFRGGITDARGHAGSSVGRARIVARLLRHHEAPEASPVFGCALTETARAN